MVFHVYGMHVDTPNCGQSLWTATIVGTEDKDQSRVLPGLYRLEVKEVTWIRLG